MEDHDAWRERVRRGGARPTPLIDRFCFRSVYFREPSGVLFEIATLGPGFTSDEDPEHLGEVLILPPAFEHLRDQIEPVLAPLPDPGLGYGTLTRPRRDDGRSDQRRERRASGVSAAIEIRVQRYRSAGGWLFA